MNRKTIIPLLGAPCSGKSTAGRASEFEYFSFEEFLNNLAGGMDNYALSARQGYFDDSFYTEMFSGAVEKYSGPIVLVSGFPTNPVQASYFNQEILRKNQEVPFAVYFDCEDKILNQRRSALNENSQVSSECKFLSSNMLDQVVKWYKDEGYLRTIDASQNKGDVLRSLTAIVTDVRT